ncbi:MAG: glycosyltransferase [Dysgonamonadaceae bacterium]|jgi:glycosyltransferase involved in cell wall biosynthesis|nr:glycosyltransferase [Dysgonamonadaceae bacterium]
MELITLAMPVYNVEPYVEKALLSALNQTYEQIEYIIVDDKGNDHSMDVVRKILSTHPRGNAVKIIEHPVNIGTGATKNTAIDAAQGKYLYFMDSDDEITPRCIEMLYAKMQNENVDFIIGSWQSSLRNGDVLTRTVCNQSSIRGQFAVARQFFEKRNKAMAVFTWNKLYRIAFLRDNNIRCIPDQLIEDNIFSFQYFLHANACAFVSDVTYIYYDTPTSNTNRLQKTNFSLRLAREFVQIISFYKEYSKHYRGDTIYESLLAYIIFYIPYLSLKIQNNNIIEPSERKKLLKEITRFPLTLNEIFCLRRKKLFFLIQWFIFKMPLPFRIALFKIIQKLSVLKKKILP